MVRFWGSRESAFQQMALQAFEDVEAAVGAADAGSTELTEVLVRAKVGRGYRVVSGKGKEDDEQRRQAKVPGRHFG